jgi:NAD(P)H-hydrate epimerase
VLKSFLTRAEVRDVDRRAIEEYGLPGVVLMENAGRGCAALIDDGPVVVCCGRGNNGGDGFVIARHLDNRGVDVELLTVCEVADLRGDARVHADVAVRSGLPVTVARTPEDWKALESHLAETRWIVDALLGTGFSGELREPSGTAIRCMNSAKGFGARILAVDVPSGLDVDTGLPAAECIQADVTATFVARKPGFLKLSAAAFLGEVLVVDIGVPRRLLTALGLGQE